MQDIQNIKTRYTQLAQYTDVLNFTIGGVIYLKSTVLTFK